MSGIGFPYGTVVPVARLVQNFPRKIQDVAAMPSRLIQGIPPKVVALPLTFALESSMTSRPTADQRPLKGLSPAETLELSMLSTTPGEANDARWIELYLKREAAKLMDEKQVSPR
jgi:hypothetical protein